MEQATWSVQQSTCGPLQSHHLQRASAMGVAQQREQMQQRAVPHAAALLASTRHPTWCALMSTEATSVEWE